MRKISLILIFCFLFQGCFSFSFFVIAELKYEGITQHRKYCSFEEFMESPKDKYAFRIGSIGGVIDLGLVINYYLKLNPVGLHLFGVFAYASIALGTLMGAVAPPFRTQEGWKRYSEIECRDDYFVIKYESIDFNLRKNLEPFFIKAILNYPLDSDISQDQNFANFQKDFLRNTKIQTYSKENYFYRYIHYPGGKAKFEEDFGKYLHKK